MSSVFARLGLCTLLLLTIQGSVQGFPTEDSSGSNEVDLAQNNATETVDGKWSAWKPWSECSTTCGPTGVRTRQRKCEPAERHGGNDCIGDRQESGSCNRHVECPGPPTRAPCRKATTPSDYYGDVDEYDYGGGGNAAAEEGTTTGRQSGNYGNYDCDC